MQLFHNPEPELNFLSEEESKHCVRVLRKHVGDLIHIMDGKGKLYQAIITQANPKKCEYVIEKVIKELEKPIKTHIAIAPTKNLDRIGWFVEKAVEIGVTDISFIICEHSERKVLKLDRLKSKALSAAKQSGALWFPNLNSFNALDQFIEQDNSVQRFIAHLEEGNSIHLMELAKPGLSSTVLIGPEGDFSGNEVELATNKGFKPVTLGEKRLRTETAGIVACHILTLINEI